MGVSRAAKSRSRRRRGRAVSTAAAGWGPALQRRCLGWERPRRSGCLSQRGRRALRTDRTRSRTSWSAPWLHRSPTSDPRTTSIGLPRSVPGTRRACHATRRTAPTVATAPGCGKPVRGRLPGPSGVIMSEGSKWGPWCGPAAAAGRLARLPQRLPEPPAPRPVPLSWHGGRGGGPRKHPLARRILERARSGRSGARVRGGDVGACMAWGSKVMAGSSERSGFATRGFANRVASRRPLRGRGRVSYGFDGFVSAACIWQLRSMLRGAVGGGMLARDSDSCSVTSCGFALSEPRQPCGPPAVRWPTPPHAHQQQGPELDRVL